MSGDVSFDVVIVGAGPAGCVLARRLTEDADRTVALLEAGPDYGPDPTAWPADLRDAVGTFPSSHSWGYLHADRPADRPLDLARSKVVGGTSTVNGCLWLRGSAADYDGWAALGNPGWSFDDLLPYFRRVESDPLGGPLHGTDGPIPISRAPRESLTPVDQALIASAEELLLPYVADFNGDRDQRPGVGPAPKNVEDGVRMNAAFTYLAPARARPNFTLIPDALIDRVLIEDGRAIGVRTADGRAICGREVVLCAGAYGSPAILLRSGIGPAAELRALGVTVVADRPGVGANLLDHPNMFIADHDGETTFLVKPEYAPAETTFMANIIKARSSQVSDEIDLHIYSGQFLDASGAWALWFSVSLQSAVSRGRVRLTTLDPEATLHIDHAHLGDATDLEAICDGVELLGMLVATPPLARMIEPVPGQTPPWHDRDDLRAWVRERIGTTYHPSSTCRMGPSDDPDAVVDATGRVHGVAGLRVADASIFPTGPRANIHCTVVAVAEKLADAIRGRIDI